MMEQMISVIVPVYNGAKTLSQCLDSLLAQDYAPIQIIVVNDGSQDETAEIMAAYGKINSQMRLIHQPNLGVTAARMAGIGAAEGAYIGFMDADDTVEPDMYRQLLQHLQQAEADIAHCGCRMEFPDGRVRDFYNTGRVQKQTAQDALKALLAGAFEPNLWSKLYRRELFAPIIERIPRDIRIHEDLLMNFLLLQQAKTVVYADICLYHYRIHRDSASRRALNRHRVEDPVRVKERILADAPPELKADAQRALLFTCVHTYNSVVLARNVAFQADGKTLRRKIRAQKSLFSLLDSRTRLMARLICSCPSIYAPLYWLYSRLFQKSPYL